MISNWKNYRSLPAAFPGFLLLILLFVVVVGNGWSQNIIKVEYFFNTDPGFDAGTEVPVIPPTPDLTNFNFDVSIDGLNDGFHKLYVRAKDENGIWSFTHSRAFYKNTFTTQLHDLTKVEYFIDTDPGSGNGTNVPFTPGPEISNLEFNIDISNLPAGFHHLYIRAKNQQGIWSLTDRRSFLIEVVNIPSPWVSMAEYFIDTDPGFGQGTMLPFTPNGSNVTLDFNVDLSGLPDGFHQLYIRVKDTEGLWSLTSRRSFLKENINVTNKIVTNIEYFFDADPGPGQGQSIPFTPSPNVVITNHIIDISSLSDGFHKLYIRAKDETGSWSQTNIRSFFKKQVIVPVPNLIAAEYYIDSDPGFGLGIDLPVAGNATVEELSFIEDISSLSEGMHKIFVRIKDEDNRWSQTNMYMIYKLNQIPEPGNIVYAEYFIDTDPGMGLGMNIPVPNPGPNVTDLTFEVDETQLVMGNHMLFMRTRDENNRWSLTLLDQFCHSPQADFSANNVWLGNETTFTNLSTFTDENTEYYWDVDGDNVTDYTYNHGFTHLYADVGTYNARLILVSAEGCPDTIVKQVSVFTCSAPTALSVTDTTATSAILHWTAANMETAWDIEYGQTGFTLGTGILLSNISNNDYELIGLASNTAYDFYVRSACYSSTVSSWVGPQTFTTFEGAPCSNPTDGGTIADSQAICFGTVPDPFTSLSPATGYTGILEYKWQFSTDNIDFVDIPGSNSEAFTFTSSLTATTWFRRIARVTCKPDWTAASSSDTIQVSIDALDRYRTKASGDWDNPATWEVFNGTQWVDATDYPSSAFISCPNPLATVQNGHIINIHSNVGFGNIDIDSGGTLEIDNDAALGINSGDTLIVNGTLIMHSTAVVNGAGHFKIVAGGTIHVGAVAGITVSTAVGNIQVSGSRTYASGAHYIYIGTANQVTGDAIVQNTPGNITINAPGYVVSLSQALSISGNIHIIQGTLDVSNFDITLSGNWINDGIFIPGSATVYFTATVNVTVSISNFYNVVFAGSDTITAGGSLTVYGDITINNYFNGGSYTHYVYGNWFNNGIFVYGTSTIQFMGTGTYFISISNFYNIIFAGSGTYTALGSLTIYGDVTINNYFDAGTFVHYVYGNWTNNGVFAYGTSTIQFMGSGNVYIGASAFYNVIFAGTGTITAFGDLTFYGYVTINNYFDAGAYTFYVYGNWVNNGTFVYGTSTVNFVGSGNIVIGSSSFYNVIFGGTGTITAGGSLAIYGDVTINNYFDAGTYVLSVYGNWTNNGTFIYNTSTVEFTGSGNILISQNDFYNVIFGGTGVFIATGSLNFYGNITINSTFDGGSYEHYVYGNWINNGNFIYGTSTIYFVGTVNVSIGVSNFYNVVFAGSGTYTAIGSLTIFGDITINTYFDAGSFEHFIYGNWINNGTFVYGTSTINFVGSGNTYLGVYEFYNVVFAGSGTITATGSITFYGNVTINNYFDASTFIHYVYGNWTNNGTFVFGTSTIYFMGSGNIYIGISNFYNVIFGGSGTIAATGSLTIYGDVTINNYFDAGSFVHYIYGNWINNGTFVYGTSTIYFTATINIYINVNEFYNVVFAGTGNYIALGSITFYGDVTINNYFDAGSFVHYVYGNWTVNGVFVYGTSTIHFLGSGNIYIGVSNFYNIIFGGTGTITASGSLTIFGNVTINNYFDGGSYVHYIYGNWVNNGVYVYGTSTIQFIGTGNITVGTSDFYHIIFGGTGTIAATGSLSIYGDFTINNYFDAGSYTHYIYGNWYNYGIFVYGTSTIHFSGSGNIFLNSEEFYHVIFGGTGTITATGTLIFHGDVTINNYFSAGSFTHYVYGNWTNTGTFVYGTSTIQFTGSGNIQIGASSFYHIIFGGTGTIVATGSLSVYGDLTINNYFDAGSYVHYIYGNWYNNGVFIYGTSTIHFAGSGTVYLGGYEFYHVIFGGTGMVVSTGTLTIHGNVTINNYFDAGSYVHYVYGNWTNNGTFVHNTSTIQFVGNGNILIGSGNFYHVVFACNGSVTATGSIHFYGNVTITNHFDAASYEHYVYGNWINNGTFVHGTSTIRFVGTLNLTLGVNNFYHVVFARTGNIVASGSLTIYGNLTINNYFDAGTFTHYVYGDWINNGTFDYGTSTIEFTGNDQQLIGGNHETVFYRFRANNPAGILLNFDVSVYYLLTLTEGIITTGGYVFRVMPTGTISGGSATAFIYGRLICGYSTIGSRIFPVGTSNDYGPMVLNYLNLSGTSMVQVEYFEGVIPGTIPANITTVADHYWVISQSGGYNFTFTLTLNVSGFNPSGSVWMLRGDGLNVNSYATTIPDYTNVVAFDTFGDFTLGELHCASPKNLINRYITLTDAILDWEPGDMEQQWNVEYGPAGFTQGTGTFISNVTEKPLAIAGLTAHTYYEFYVQSICSEEVQSDWVGPEPFSTFPKQLNAKIFLEGPYDVGTDEMLTDLATSGLLPLDQPYGVSPWNYSGSEQVSSIPANIVDWILIEWRDATSPGSADNSTWIWRKVAFIKNDGNIVDLDGSNLPWIGNPQVSGSLYVIIRHRNHLDVIANAGATLQDEIWSYDFSDALSKVYGGSSGYKQIGFSPTRFGMISGDGNGDGQILLNGDKNDAWSTQTGKKGYFNVDYNMNGQVQNQDKNDMLVPNLGKQSAVP